LSAETVDELAAAQSAERFRAAWELWHRETDARRLDPTGALAFTGLHWLTELPQRFPGVPGAWSVRGERAVVVLGSHEQIDGIRAEGAERTIAVGRSIRFPGGSAEIALRGGHLVLRPRLASSPFPTGFLGTPVYEPDQRWVVPARFIAEPAGVDVDAAIAGIRHHLTSPGRIVLTLDGAEHELTLTDGQDAWRLLFTDATTGQETYPAGRSVRVPRVADGGTTYVNFTRATNPPCAYSDFTTCPLPPAGNRLPVRVEAGERSPKQRLIDGDEGAALIPVP
jgi:uncharacterized protein (DUF1684 family)